MAAAGTCCCGCCSLGTGTQLIAILCLISSACSVATDIAAWAAWSQSRAHSDQWLERQVREFGFGFLDESGVLFEVLAVSLLLSIAQFVLSALLCIGSVQGNVRRCLAWLWYNSVLTAVLAAISLTVVGAYFVKAEEGSPAKGALLLATVFIGIAVYVYLLSVVHRHIKELRQWESERPPPAPKIVTHDPS